MGIGSLVLRTGEDYVVEDRFKARIEERAGSYQITFADDTKNILGIAESSDGTKAVLSIGLTKSKRKVVIEPSPLVREEV